MKKGNRFLHTIDAGNMANGDITLYAPDIENKTKIEDITTLIPPAVTLDQIVNTQVSLRNLRNYIPFRSMHITNANANNVNVEIKFDYQEDRKIVCMANGIKDIKDQPFNAFSIKNTHALYGFLSGTVIMELETY